MACNSHKHHAMPKTVPELMDTAAALNCLTAEIHCERCEELSQAAGG